MEQQRTLLCSAGCPRHWQQQFLFSGFWVFVEDLFTCLLAVQNFLWKKSSFIWMPTAEREKHSEMMVFIVIVLKSEIFHSFPTQFSNSQKRRERLCWCGVDWSEALLLSKSRAQIPLKLYRAFWSCLQYLELPSNTKRAAGSKLNGRECGVWKTSNSWGC